GYCAYGCRLGGKQSTANTWLLDAQQLGDTVIIPRCRAERVLIEHNEVRGVHASTVGSDGGPVTVTVHAPRVVVAAGALNSPALLMRSGLQHPQLGRNLFLRPHTAAGG